MGLRQNLGHPNLNFGMHTHAHTISGSGHLLSYGLGHTHPYLFLWTCRYIPGNAGYIYWYAIIVGDSGMFCSSVVRL